MIFLSKLLKRVSTPMSDDNNQVLSPEEQFRQQALITMPTQQQAKFL